MDLLLNSHICIYHILNYDYIMHIYIITSKALEMFRPSIACPQTQQTWWPDFKWQVTSVHWQSMTSKLLSNGALGLRFTSETSGCSESPWPQTGKGQWAPSTPYSFRGKGAFSEIEITCASTCKKLRNSTNLANYLHDSIYKEHSSSNESINFAKKITHAAAWRRLCYHPGAFLVSRGSMTPSS